MANSGPSVEEALAELEKRSRRSRSILLIGTFLIVVLLIAFAFYLNRLRTEALEQAATWKARADELNVTLAQTRREIANRNVQKAGELITIAQVQTRELSSLAADAAGRPPTAPPENGPVLLYIHISEEGQRAAALQLEARLESSTVGRRPIVVPGVELVATRGSSSLRCLRPAECGYAGDLQGVIAQHMPAPPVRVLNLSGQYPNARVRPGTFELWLEAGPIQLN